VKISLMDN